MYTCDIINESKAGDINNIVNSSYHIYSHLMKFVTVRPILPGWIGTINEQCDQLMGIANATCWREVTGSPSKLAKIKRKAIEEYNKDNKNMNGEIAFNIVYNDFYDITKFRDKSILKDYMISHLDPVKDKEIIEKINEILV